MTIHKIFRPNTSWYTTELKLQKRKLRLLEKTLPKPTYPKSAQSIEYSALKNSYRANLNIAKSNHISNTFLSNRNNSKAIFKLANNLLGRIPIQVLPDTNILDLPNVFDQFFDNKISNILSKLPPCRPDPTPTQTKHSFSSFSIPSITTIIKFLKASQSSSATDPLPLTLITLFSPQLANKLLPIFSHSLTTGIVPKSFKCAIITPIIKKPSLDPSELNHYRPISNLSIFSKTLERIVSTQLTNYLSTNNILNKYQSAFCPDKSCETTITNLSSNILPTIDKLGTLFFA